MQSNTTHLTTEDMIEIVTGHYADLRQAWLSIDHLKDCPSCKQEFLKVEQQVKDRMAVITNVLDK